MRRFVIPAAVVLLTAMFLGGVSYAQPGRGDAAFQIRLGGFFPRGDSDFWRDTEERFTIRPGDFDAFQLGFTYVHSVNNNFEVGLNLDLYNETQISQERDFVDEFGLPILHDTTLQMVPISVDFRLIPGGRYRLRGGGRRVLQPVFYIGGGAGVNFYEYEEIGDFVDDFVDPPEVFPSRFVADGAAFSAHALAGLEMPMGGPFSVMLEGRYTWAEDDLDDDFAGFGDIDLGGPSVFVGGAFRW